MQAIQSSPVSKPPLGLTGMKISFVFVRRQKKRYAFITRNAGACLRTETADIRMAYGAAYPKTSTPSYIEVSSAGSTAGGDSNIHCNSKIVGKNWLWLCCSGGVWTSFSSEDGLKQSPLNGLVDSVR